MDTPILIGQEVKAIMQLIANMDPYFPEEDAFEVLVGAVSAWGVLETKVLFPALEANLEGSETVTAPARERLNTLYSLESTIHDGEGAEGPFNELAPKYIDAVKYHLVVDVKELVPLASQLTEAQSVQLARSMTAMKLEME